MRAPPSPVSESTPWESIYRQIIADPAYLENINWGQRRPGHPEGSVRAHIAELEGNLARLKPTVSAAQFWRLRVLVHVHDTFKAGADRGVPIPHPMSHASLARAFLAKFTDDEPMLHIVQFHDKPFSLWRQFRQKGTVDPEQLDSLRSTIADWDLFLLFLLIDGLTAGKDIAYLDWFFDVVRGTVKTNIGRSSADPILPGTIPRTAPSEEGDGP